MKTLMPRLRHIYLFRSPKKSIESLTKVWKAYPPICKAIGLLEDFNVTLYPLTHTIPHGNIPEMIASGLISRNKAVVFLILASLRSARDFVERNGPFDALFTFEDFLGKDDEMLRLFELFGSNTIDKSWKKEDSQANTMISQENLKRISGDSEEKSDEFVDFFQIPDIDASVEDFKTYINNNNN